MRKPLSLFLCFAAPSLILVTGLLLAGFYGFRQIPELFQEEARGMLPEGFKAKLPERGKYTIWLPVSGEEEDGGEGLPPGARLYVFDDASAREFEISKWLQATRYVGDEKSVSLGTFESQRPGQVVEVKATGMSEPLPVSISLENMGEKLAVVFTLVIIVGITLITTIFVFIYLMHRRQKVVEELLESE